MRTTIRTPWAASLLLGAVMAGLIVTPALAAARYQPDGLIRMCRPSCPWLGKNIYNATGAHQSAVFTQSGGGIAADAYLTFDISIQNDGSAVDSFRVKATGPASSAWTVSYSRGSTNITPAVVAGTYRTPSLAPGATYLIHAKIVIKEVGSVTRLVTIRSVTSSTKLDAVKFGFLWKPCLPGSQCTP
jgi:hypothetical protein